MRIIAGKHKSRLIHSPKGVNLRPTSDRVKESLFGILGGFIIGKYALDLFSGTGNLGIEALSRGARSCVFVDNNPRCVTAIKKNLDSLGIKNNTEVALKDVFKYLNEANAKGVKFDLIFLDPPYYGTLVKKSLILLDDYIYQTGLISHPLKLIEGFNKIITIDYFCCCNNNMFSRIYFCYKSKC